MITTNILCQMVMSTLNGQLWFCLILENETPDSTMKTIPSSSSYSYFQRLKKCYYIIDFSNEIIIHVLSHTLSVLVFILENRDWNFIVDSNNSTDQNMFIVEVFSYFFNVFSSSFDLYCMSHIFHVKIYFDQTKYHCVMYAKSLSLIMLLHSIFICYHIDCSI